jgi:hypothetical protein
VPEETSQSSSAGETATSQTQSSSAGSGSQTSQVGSATQQTQTAATQAARPEYVPESFWDAKTNKITDEKQLAAHYNEIIARDAAERIRKNALPASADAYKIELPKDFTPPQGVKYEFKADDPLLAQARTVAHELGIGQDGFSKLLGLYAGSQVASQQQIVNARNAEIAKLGTAGPARVDALTTFYKAHLGEAEGSQIMARVLTASDVALHEKLIAKFQGQGGANFSVRGREAPLPEGRLSDEQHAKLSPAEKLDYARRFDQSKLPGWKDPRAA